jgi:uncharacterized protein YbcI
MPVDDVATPSTPSAPTNVLMEVSNAMVALYKDYFGRGPNRTRAHWCGDSLLCVVLEETLTPSERKLAQLGEHQRLRDVRMFFQYVTVKEFCDPVERLTGRKVRAFVSGMDTEVDGLCIESFVLHPVGYEGPSRSALADI